MNKELDKINMKKVLNGEDIIHVSSPNECGEHYEEKNWKEFGKEKQEMLRKFIRENLETRKTINYKHSSYGLKHTCEAILGFYIHNDVIKKALILEGFEAETSKLNWYFNISEKSFDNLLEIRLQNQQLTRLRQCIESCESLRLKGSD